METINNNYFKGSKKIIKRVLYPILLLLLLLLLSVNSIYTIREQEQAVLTTFGIATPVTDSGLHFKIPMAIIQMKQNL